MVSIDLLIHQYNFNQNKNVLYTFFLFYYSQTLELYICYLHEWKRWIGLLDDCLGLFTPLPTLFPYLQYKKTLAYVQIFTLITDQKNHYMAHNATMSTQETYVFQV